jgi:hypothetical protein
VVLDVLGSHLHVDVRKILIAINITCEHEISFLKLKKLIIV